MNEQEFRARVRYAETMLRTAHGRYWEGYARGVRRAYHGENFGTKEVHETLLAFASSDDPDRQKLGQGYVDGWMGIDPRKPTSTLDDFVQLRERFGYSTEEVSEAFGLHRRYIYRVEVGERAYRPIYYLALRGMGPKPVPRAG